MVLNRFKLNVLENSKGNLKGMRKKVKDTIAEVLANNNFIVDSQFEEQPVKLSIYEVEEETERYKNCAEYLLSVHATSSEMDISISFLHNVRFLLIDDISQAIPDSFFYFKYILDNRIVRTKNREDLLGKFVKVDNDTESEISYKERYDKIKHLVSIISKFEYNGLFSIDDNFEEVDNSRIEFFDRDNSLVFKNGNIDKFAFDGFTKYGPYQFPRQQRKLLFVTPHTTEKDRLSYCWSTFSDFEKYFGFSYAEYPAIVYNDTHDIQKAFEAQFHDDAYVICVADRLQDIAFFKSYLLSKNIPFTFLESNFVMSSAFYLSIPEVSLSMVAKMGGIPFLLNTSDEDSIVCGIKLNLVNDHNIGLGAVVFNGKGVLMNVFVSSGEMKANLGKLVYVLQRFNGDKYFFHLGDYVAYMKMSSLFHDEFKRIDKPYAITVFDTVHPYMDVAFDVNDRATYMPVSGTCIYAGGNKRLLFNNSKYTQNTLFKVVNETPPISIRNFIYKNKIKEQEVIEKIFLFDYLNYRSFKKKFLPVTVYYAKHLMKEVQLLGLPLPNTDVAKRRLWFI